MNNQIEVGRVYEYFLTGNQYKVVGLCMVKTYREGTENGWSKAVAYVALKQTPLQTSTYVRELEDFEFKFRMVNVADEG